MRVKAEAMRDLNRAAERGEPVSEETALAILRSGPEVLPALLCAADAARRRCFGNRVQLCAILNARSGACPEDCTFCAQSSHHRAKADVFPLLAEDRIASAYEEASRLPIRHFGVVTSGEAVDDEGVERVCRAIRARPGRGVSWCASLGTVSPENLRALKAAGLRRFHHNLETALSFFSNICTTHGYAERLATVRAVKAAGLEVCSGGILGMGESLEQRVEFAAILLRESVDSIPLNFLIPILGTPLATRPPMAPLDILRAIAMFRLVNPRAEIRVCAGRVHLRDLQSMIFLGGANAMMIGPLLTVPGRRVEDDLRMLRDLGVDYAR